MTLCEDLCEALALETKFKLRNISLSGFSSLHEDWAAAAFYRFSVDLAQTLFDRFDPKFPFSHEVHGPYAKMNVFMRLDPQC